MDFKKVIFPLNVTIIVSDFFSIDDLKEALRTQKRSVIFKRNHLIRVTLEKFLSRNYFTKNLE